MEFNTEINIADLIAIFLAFLAIILTLIRNTFDRNEIKNNIVISLLDRCHVMNIQCREDRILINQILDKNILEKALKLNDESFNNIDEMYQAILLLEEKHDLISYKSALKHVLSMQKTNLRNSKIISDFVCKINQV